MTTWSDATFSPSLTFDADSGLFTPMQYAGGMWFLAVVRGLGSGFPGTLSTDLYVASSPLGTFTKVTLPTISGVPYSPGVARNWIAYDGARWVMLVGGQAGIGAAFTSIHILHTTDPFGTWTAVEPSPGLTANPLSIGFGHDTWALWAYEGFTQQVVEAEAGSPSGLWSLYTLASEVGTGGSVASYANSVVVSGSVWGIAYSENSGGPDVNGVRYAYYPGGPWTDVPATFVNPENVVRHHANGYWTVQSFLGTASRIYYSKNITASSWSYVDSSTIGFEVYGLEHTGTAWVATGSSPFGSARVAVCKGAGAPSGAWTLENTGADITGIGQYTHQIVSDGSGIFAMASTSMGGGQMAVQWGEIPAPAAGGGGPAMLRQRQRFIP